MKTLHKLKIAGGLIAGATALTLLLGGGETATLASKYNQATEIKAKYQLDNASLVKTDIKNAELDVYKGEPKDEIKITLGDKDSAEFTSDIEMKRWNEVSFKLKPNLDSVATKDKNLIFEGEKVKFDTPKISFEMYDVPATATDEGSYKFIWYLNEKPATNKVEFDIETTGLDFFYQPALNVENKDPNLTCTETQCTKDGVVVMERPENVVGSYAVYHSTKGGMNDINGKEYRVGKAFHIYRPHIIDAVGKETWGILSIANGIYSVEIPQEFLDKAIYPIRSNDTFGYLTAGATWGGTGTDALWGSVYTSLAYTGTLVSMTCWYKNTNTTTDGTIKFVVVLRSSLTIVSSGITPSVTLIKNKLVATEATGTFATPPTVSASTDYALSWVQGLSNGAIYLDTTGSEFINDVSNNFTTPTDPTDAAHTGTFKNSVYATYTAGGGAAKSHRQIID